MPLVQFKDDASLKRALGILFYEVAGSFFVRPNREILVGKQQFNALKEAGLVDVNGQSMRNQDGAKSEK